MGKFTSIEKDFHPVKLARVDEVKIDAIVRATKEFIESKLDYLVEKNKIQKLNADYMKKKYAEEVDNCRMDIKHAFITANGLVYPLLKSIGNCVLHAFSSRDKKLMLVEALAVFEANVQLLFKGRKIGRASCRERVSACV